MPNLNINTKITAPENIDIELVRADLLSTSNTYRTFFEVFLSIASALLGAILSNQQVTPLHWIFFTVVSISAVFFLVLSMRVIKKAKTTS